MGSTMLETGPHGTCCQMKACPSALFSFDRQSRVLTWGPDAERLFGWTATEAIGKVLPIVPDEEFENHSQIRSRILSGEYVSELMVERRQKSGNKATFIIALHPLKDDCGTTIGVIEMAREISLQQTIEREQELAVKFFDQVNRSHSTRELVSHAVRFFRRELDFEAVGIRLEDGDDYPYYETHGFPGEFVLMENYLCRRDVNGDPIYDKDCHPALSCMCGNVIRGRFAPDKPFFTENGNFWSNNTTRLLQTTSNADRMAHTRNRCNGEGYESVGLFALRTGEKCLGLLQLNDHRPDRFSVRSIALYERLAAHLAVALAKAQVDEALARSEFQFRQLVANLDDVVYSTDIDGNILFVSAAIESMLGFSSEKLTGESFLSLVYPEDRDKVQDALVQIRSQMKSHFEFRTIDKNGQLRHLRSNARIRLKDGTQVGMDGIIVDMTDYRRIEEQLSQSRRLEAVGQLAGGIAHDFNNLLSVILNYADFALEALPDSTPARAQISEIQHAGERAAALTGQLLAFSRRQILKPRVMNINESIHSVERILARLIGEDIDLITPLDESLGKVFADASQVEQILMNLSINARDAMPRGGRLTIQTTTASTADISECQKLNIPADRNYICLSVADTGSGMDAQTQEHIFEPFFTTKEEGKGTGLGLATVYGIVKQNNGFIEVDSAPGKGTVFSIYLPETDLSDADRPSDGAADERRLGHETILLVEDEKVVQTLVAAMLSKSGYNIITASNGVEAFELLNDDQHKKIDLLLTDVVMPRMGGPELAEELKKLRPQIKTLFMSGYTDNAIIHRGVSSNDVDFIAKPFRANELTNKIREILDT